MLLVRADRHIDAGASPLKLLLWLKLRLKLRLKSGFWLLVTLLLLLTLGLGSLLLLLVVVGVLTPTATTAGCCGHCVEGRSAFASLTCRESARPGATSEASFRRRRA